MIPMMRATTHKNNQAIIALCTPRGSGAIALLRLSGADAFVIGARLANLSSGLDLATVTTHTIHHGHVIDPQAPLTTVDEVLFLAMRAPKTFTGDDTIEITCHNNPFIIEQIIQLALAAGARSAEPGEFTRRAFLNEKIDVVQAEAINDLIHAQTEQALRQSMAQLRGSLSHALTGVETQLVHLLSYIEASFEFLDEEQRDLDFTQAIKDRVAALITTIAGLRTQFAHQKQIRDGVRVAVVGSVNAGKSTLFNALVGHERAIVSAIPGTTRDSVESSLYRAGTHWLFIDTAGIRRTDDGIEQKGIERSRSEAQLADIVVVVIDAARVMTEPERMVYTQILDLCGDKALVVLNKADQALTDQDHDIVWQLMADRKLDRFTVSAQTGVGVEELMLAIQAYAQKLFAQAQSPFLLNQRQFKLLTEIQLELESIAKSFTDGVHYELLAYRVKDLVQTLSQLTGKNITEQVLDTVFGEFCIGK